MLTYATLDDFKIAKQIVNIKPPQISAERLKEADDKIINYLVRATKYIDRFTRREFFPWRQTRKFAIPHKYADLAMRRFTMANLYFDQDLLEVYELTNSNGDALEETTDYFLIEANISPKNAVQLKFPNYWGGGFNTFTWSKSIDDPVLVVDALWGFHNTYGRDNEAWIDTYDTVHTDGILSTDKTIKVGPLDQTDALSMPRYSPGYLLKVGTEFMEVVKLNQGTDPDSDPDNVTVIRGVRGTTAVDHTDPTVKIYRWNVMPEITQACLQIAKTWRESDTSAGGRLGVSDYSAGVEIGIPADPLNVIKMYQRSLITVNS